MPNIPLQRALDLENERQSNSKRLEQESEKFIEYLCKTQNKVFM